MANLRPLRKQREFQKHRIFTLNEPTTLRYNSALAVEIGERESMLLLQLEYLIVTQGDEINGVRCLQASVTTLLSYFEAWSFGTMQRTIENLRSKGLIATSAPPGKSKYSHGGQVFRLRFENICQLQSVLVAGFEPPPAAEGHDGPPGDSSPDQGDTENGDGEQGVLPYQNDKVPYQNGTEGYQDGTVPYQNDKVPYQDGTVAAAPYRGRARGESEEAKEVKEPEEPGAATAHICDPPHPAPGPTQATDSGPANFQNSFPDVPTPQDATDLVDRILALGLPGLDQRKAQNLVKYHPEEVAKQLVYWPWRRRARPNLTTGAFISSVRRHWETPENMPRDSGRSQPAGQPAGPPRSERDRPILAHQSHQYYEPPARPLTSGAPPVTAAPQVTAAVLPSAFARSEAAACDVFLAQLKQEHEPEHRRLFDEARDCMSKEAAELLQLDPENAEALQELHDQLRIIVACDYRYEIEDIIREQQAPTNGVTPA